MFESVTPQIAEAVVEPDGIVWHKVGYRTRFFSWQNVEENVRDAIWNTVERRVKLHVMNSLEEDLREKED